MRIDVSGQQFVFPNICACCGCRSDCTIGVYASKSSGKKIVHTKTNGWDFPYCRDCVDHVRAADRAGTVAWVLSIVSLVAGSALGFTVSTYLGVSVGLVALAAKAILHRRQLGAARNMCSRDCVCVERAVAYLGWHGSLHQFWIGSHGYALSFMVANQRKLVNLSHAARGLLEVNGHGVQPGAPRAPRRYSS